MKTLFFSILFMENFFLSTSTASDYSKEELADQILTAYKDFIKLESMTFPPNTDPSAFGAMQEDLAITYSVLENLLETYFTRTGKPFLLPELSSTTSSSTYTPPIDTLQINTPVQNNKFRTIFVGRNKEEISLENRLKEAQQNSLLPVRLADPDKNLCQLEFVRPNKTPAKPAEQSSAM